MIPCKTCIKSRDNAVHASHDLLLSTRTTTVIGATADDKKETNHMSCLVTSDEKLYRGKRLLIPNPISEVINGQMKLLIANFSNETIRINSETAIGEYELIA